VNRRRFSERVAVLLCAALTTLSAGCASAPRAQPNLDATLWVQTAAEYGAVTRSIYLAALQRLPALLADSAWSAAPEQDGNFSSLPAAVILDVDETVLDNSPYQARLLVAGDSYSSDTWASWVDERIADPVPGALEYTIGAESMGITVFYLTNRRVSQERATRDNLEALGFPLRPDLDVILTRGEQPDWHGTKSTRRSVVASTHRVLMLVGDDLNDFVDVDGLTVDGRDDVAARYGEYWGDGWYMLPNPTYGSWERALFDSDYGLAVSERTDRKAKHLEPKGEENE
jgi:5'-nucleotidase (lipoprotein e(P4) family)